MTPSVATGVFNFIGFRFEIRPPTIRKTPLVTLSAISPVPAFGSKTYLSMVIFAFGPIVMAVPSLNSNCVRPTGPVSTFSLK